MTNIQQPGRILLIRHGRTAGNGQRYVGWEDLPLDAEGQAQALAVAARLVGEQVDTIYASSLARALATAQPLAAQRGLPVMACPALREIDYGDYQGLLKAERALRLRRQHTHTRLPNGESLFDVYQRVCTLLDPLGHDLASGRQIAIVGHFWSNRMLVGALRRQPFDEIIACGDYRPANGSIFALHYCPGGPHTWQAVPMGWLEPL